MARGMNRCHECKSVFIRPLIQNGVPSCPICGNPKFVKFGADKRDLRFTGQINEEGMALYKDADTGEDVWLQSSHESIKSKPVTPTPEEPPEDKKKSQQKHQSDYHKRRYRMIKDGTWSGSMNNADL